jgi:hypothetical protein|tara:strand:- start:644 stop:856 length:213 start_codon:yes stop_codon:yes gene_type:complete
MSMIHGYLNSVPDDFGHRWTNSVDNETVECQYCGDSFNSKRWCTNRLVVSEQLRQEDEEMSKYFGEEVNK